VGAYAAAIFHVVTHAFFKATLFLGAGSVIHATDDNQDMRTMGGLRKYMPYTAGAFIVAWLAIAGIPPFSGFWSKDEILAKAYFAEHYGVWVIGTVAAGLTAFYMAREVYLVFFGNERFRVAAAIVGRDAPEEAPAESLHEGDAAGHTPSLESPTVEAFEPPKPARLDHDPHEAPSVMTLPVLVLAALAAVGGALSLPFKSLEFLADWLDPVFKDAAVIHTTSFQTAFVLSTLSVAFGVVGIVVAHALYRSGIPAPDADPLPARLGPLARVFQHAWYVDEAISSTVHGPVRRFADWLTNGFDLGGIDGAVNGVAGLVRRAGAGLRRVQTGLVRNYALGVIFGAAALLLWIAVRGG
jgi:NADH-quinone oxidoreductase subunit L